MQNIERSSSEPYYLQLANIIERMIADGELKSGQRIPSESELCRRYDLARSTVRETFRTLEQKNLIRLVPRRGAFVSDQSDNRWRLQVTQGFLEPGAHSAGTEIETRVLQSAEKPLPDRAARALGLQPGTVGFELQRLRLIDGLPAMHSTNWLPLPVGQSLAGKPVLRGEGSLNATLRQAGHHIFRARREVAAVIAPQHVAGHLQVSKTFPVLLVRSISRDASGMAFDYYESHARNDVVTISVDAEALADGDAAG
ncbi:GntR family transcriptional regulator [Paracoccus sp. (in: a-proteobacteria)]|uniref:GntR family transcriptional regulator n=1 Tax=Paracoccus sp. TaxID=267 RepID=UPI003A892DDA